MLRIRACANSLDQLYQIGVQTQNAQDARELESVMIDRLDPQTVVIHRYLHALPTAIRIYSWVRGINPATQIKREHYLYGVRITSLLTRDRTWSLKKLNCNTEYPYSIDLIDDFGNKTKREGTFRTTACP